MNSRFIKKIPPGSEVVNLLVGEIEELHRRVAALVRLKVSYHLALLYVLYDSASLFHCTTRRILAAPPFCKPILALQAISWNY